MQHLGMDLTDDSDKLGQSRYAGLPGTLDFVVFKKRNLEDCGDRFWLVQAVPGKTRRFHIWKPDIPLATNICPAQHVGCNNLRNLGVLLQANIKQ
ncbi:hypothetical protein BsWGS_18681 [Bradybaena similaris]